MAQSWSRSALVPIGLWLGVGLVSAIGLWGTRPPSAAGASAPAGDFSAERALTHLGHIAAHPHSIGTDEAVRVREYLVEELRKLGAEVHIEQGIGTASYGRVFNAGLVNNIVATFQGEANTRAIMLVAHYDSVPEGPGAADDGAGLIVILEAIRALRVGPPIRNDLIVLFSDGEEARGLLGAQAFAAAHPGLKDRVAMMINLEARGSSGPALMFETSDNNGQLIGGFAKAAPYPMATSLMAAIYKLLPNDTDFTVLKAAGLPGLNFAFIETLQNYHTRLDSIENLDPRTIQHLGANVLGVVRHFGNLSLPQNQGRDLIYFNWFGMRLLAYPLWLAWTAALAAPVIFGFACYRRASSVGLTTGRVLAGLATFFVQLLIVAGAAFAMFAIAKLIAGEFLEGDTTSNRLLFSGIVGIAFGCAIGAQRFFRDKLGLANVATGQLFALASLVLVLCWFLIGGSYVLQWPLLFAIAGMCLGFRLKDAARSACQFLFLIPALLVLVPLAYMFFVALEFTYLALAAVALVLTTLLAVALPLLDRLSANLRLTLITLLLLSVSLIAAGIRLSAWSAAHPRPDTLVYSVNAEETKAKWLSYDRTLDAFTSRVIDVNAARDAGPAYTAGLERPVLSADAPLEALAPPAATVVKDSTIDGTRTVTLDIKSTRGARSLLVRLPSDLKLAAAGWNGMSMPMKESSPASSPWSLRFYNLPPEGASLELRFSAQEPARIWIADSTPGFQPNALPPPRPDDTIPGYGSDVTLVTKFYDL